MEFNHLVVFCTVPDEETAQKISYHLVENHLAACCNIIPNLRSIYFWKGKVCDDAELLLVIKTRSSAFEALRQAIRNLHPYEVPEIIALPIVMGHEDYLNWVDENVQEK